MHLLDADTLTHLDCGHETVVERLRQPDDPDIGIAIVTKAEILRGRCDWPGQQRPPGYRFSASDDTPLAMRDKGGFGRRETSRGVRTKTPFFYLSLLIVSARSGFDPETDAQVLSAMNRSLLGVRNLREVLQQAQNPADGGPEGQRFGWACRIGDRVIQTENNYNRHLFNGDLEGVE
jgi:hypothetical protein